MGTCRASFQAAKEEFDQLCGHSMVSGERVGGEVDARLHIFGDWCNGHVTHAQICLRTGSHGGWKCEIV